MQRSSAGPPLYWSKQVKGPSPDDEDQDLKLQIVYGYTFAPKRALEIIETPLEVKCTVHEQCTSARGTCPVVVVRTERDGSEVQSGADLALLERLEGRLAGLGMGQALRGRKGRCCFLSPCRILVGTQVGWQCNGRSAWLSTGLAIQRLKFLGRPQSSTLACLVAAACPRSTEGQIQNSEVVWDSATLYSHMAFES